MAEAHHTRTERRIHRISSQLPPAAEPVARVPTTFRSHRRRGLPPFAVRLVLAIAVTAAVAVPLGDEIGPLHTPPATTGLGLAAAQARPQTAQVGVTAEHPTPTIPFARFEAVTLVLPSGSTRAVAYHEAAYPDALQLLPVGRMLTNDNPTKFRAPRGAEEPGYHVLSSRGRANPATSAVDLVLDDGDDVRAVVSGRVTLVQPYRLYGRYDDTRIELVPDGRPDLRVVIIHVEGVRVRPGDRVLAGATVLADTANLFPFRSHVDRHVTGEPRPHVHVEVKAADGAAEA